VKSVAKDFASLGHAILATLAPDASAGVTV